MVSLKDGFADARVKKKSKVNNIISMMPGHGEYPIFVNKIKIGRPEHSLTPPPTSDNISFLP